MSAPPILRPLAFGEVLDSAFTLYRRNFTTFVGAALLPTLAMLAVLFATGLHRIPLDETAIAEGYLGGFALLMVVAGLGTLVLWGALTHLASQAYGGSPATVGEGLRVGLRRFFPLLGAGFVAGFLIMAGGFGLALVVGIVIAVAGMALGAAGGVVAGILVVVAMLVFYAVAAALLFALVPAVVVEEKGPISAVGRTIALARGALGRLVGLMLVSFFIVYLPILGVVVLTGTFSTMYDPEAAAAAPGSTAFILQQVLTWGVSVLTTPFLLSVIVVQYYDRRVRTEALDVQAMADRLVMA
jgi:hypothetical protein